jgi:hypothetical protein
MGDWLTVFGLLLTFLSKVGGEARKALVQGVVYLALAAAAFCGSYMLQEGGVLPGFQAAYRALTRQSEADLAGHYSASLKASAVADQTINKLLQTTLLAVPSAARVRIAIIHNGVTGLTGIGLLRFDITYAVGAPGRDAGELVENHSMTEWGDFMPKLLRGDCAMVDIGSVSNATMRARAQAMNMAAFLACPILDPEDRMLGALMVSWDTVDPVPNDPAVTVIAARLKFIAGNVGIALSLQRAS